jgi:hypothetical protein
MRTFVQGVVWRNKTTYFLRLDQVTARRKGHWRWAVPQAQEEGWDVATSYPLLISRRLQKEGALMSALVSRLVSSCRTGNARDHDATALMFI